MEKRRTEIPWKEAREYEGGEAEGKVKEVGPQSQIWELKFEKGERLLNMRLR